MSKQPDTIPKQPVLKPTEDYYRLRREGIGFIADLGSRLWTDYNTHDPGITILEALCFTITDLAYRTGWDIKDILTPEIKSSDSTQPYPNQAFFTAREILTVNPCTPDDFRRLLIDLDGVRNAWVFCKQCVCDLTIYTGRGDNNQFILDYKKPSNIPDPKISKIQPQGLYDVLLELEADPEWGDLNDRKIVQTFPIFDTDNKAQLLTLELRFPQMELLEIAGYDTFTDLTDVIDSVEMHYLAPEKPDNSKDTHFFIDDDRLKKDWQNIFYTSLKINLNEVKSSVIIIRNVTLRLFGDKEAKKILHVKEVYSLQKYLQKTTASGFVQEYRANLINNLKQSNIKRKFTLFDTNNDSFELSIELDFPDGAWTDQKQYKDFTDLSNTISKIEILRFSSREGFDNHFIDEEELITNWQSVFYTSIKISMMGKNNFNPVFIDNVLVRLNSEKPKIVQNMLLVKEPPQHYSIQKYVQETADSGFIQKYRKKLAEVKKQVEIAKTTLHGHRNLDEDYCRIKVVDIEDVAVCADVEVLPDADIERVQAQIWFEIEQYFNPPVPFYSLQEMQDAGIPIETIFNGPELENGFIKTEELQAAGLKAVLRTSDIINRLMHIEGLVSINYLSLTKYDKAGNVVKGQADPDAETGVFDPNKISASWQLSISEYHQPRFHRHLSQFLFFKNGLPFNPRVAEALDTLTQLRGEAERPKIKNTPNDLPVPSGTFRDPENYYPLQHSFPLVYGVGPEGLPLHAAPKRRAQAKQMKAYLMVFEQLLGNALVQLAHTADLFSLDTSVKRTYFVKEFSKDKFSKNFIEGYAELIDGLDKTALESITESTSEFHERRNRFLDHIMARFGEQFGEYALLLSNFQGQQVALDRLIKDKIAFLKAYPAISHDRGKAFNYRQNPCDPSNVSGLKKRVSLLLGFPELDFHWTPITSTGQSTDNLLQLKDRNGRVLHKITPPAAIINAKDTFIAALEKEYKPAAHKIAYANGQLTVELRDKCCKPIKPEQKDVLDAQKKLEDELPKALQEIIVDMSQPIKSKTDQEIKEELVGWSASQRAIVVEHLLLRPKFIGDALDPIYQNSDCRPCGDEDAYSFRLTYVMPGWAKPYNEKMAMRSFADRTIRQEVPAHLLCKICWVGNNGFDDPPNDTVINDLIELLAPRGSDTESESPAQIREFALGIFEMFRVAFKEGYKDKTLVPIKTEDLQKEFAKQIPMAIGVFSATNVKPFWPEIQNVLVAYFQQMTVTGWQFDRFEKAWCNWLEANAKIDWLEERLQERVEAILTSKLVKKPNFTEPKKGDLCNCAAVIVTAFGMAFYNWMNNEFNADKEVKADDYKTIDLINIPLCHDLEFASDATGIIKDLLNKHYKNYVDVSYRLKIVLKLLSNLHSTYPAATLHDCDDGNDQNPVRLGSTTLGG